MFYILYDSFLLWERHVRLSNVAQNHHNTLFLHCQNGPGTELSQYLQWCEFAVSRRHLQCFFSLAVEDSL